MLKTIRRTKLFMNDNINVGKTANGVKTTCETALQKLVPYHQLPGLILRHRRLSKYLNTYVDGIMQFCRDERIETIWDQTAAATGRLTSAEPNLQESY